MERRSNMVVLMVFIAASAALLQSSKAQTTTHVVGDALGWLVPPAGAAAYSTWAATQTFFLGDSLIFNYTTGEHDVAMVTEASFNVCNITNPISTYTTGPTTIMLNTTGEHYYICTFGRHCEFGMKVAINVSAAPPPAPTPSPVTSPAPSPSRRSEETYVVGDVMGWRVPPAGFIAYRTWAAQYNFMVGDTLEFNFTTGEHDVAEVTRAAFNSCNTNTTITRTTTGPARIILTTPGEHFFVCTFPQHCSFGQMLAINVTGTAISPAPTPSGSATPPPTGSTTPTTPSSPSPSGSTAPPPPVDGGSAPSLVVAALPVTILSIAMAFMY